MPCTKKNSYLSIRDFAEGRDGTIYVASTSGVCRVRSGLLVPYSNPYITGETAYALGIDRYGRLWCAMSTGKCAVMQDDRVLAMLDAELFFEDGSVISCLTSDRANNIYLGTNGSALAKVACSGQRLDGTAFTVQTYEVTDAANHNRIDVTAGGDILVSGQQGFAWATADGTQRDPPYGHEYRRGELSRSGHRGQRLAGLLQRGPDPLQPRLLCLAQPRGGSDGHGHQCRDRGGRTVLCRREPGTAGL